LIIWIRISNLTYDGEKIMKLNHRVAAMLATISQVTQINAFRKKTGKKPLPMMVEGQARNHGPAYSGRSKMFKRNRRRALKTGNFKAHAA
jgi:hypothetical protein